VRNGVIDCEVQETKSNLSGSGAILLVADGMGGLDAGEVASGMAVELVAKKLIDQVGRSKPSGNQSFIKLLKRVVQETNRIILEESQKNGNASGMGTTLTAAAVHGTSIMFAQLGDSRAYLIRNGLITQMTKDQSLVAQLVASGSITPAEAKTHPRRNVILQALGTQPNVDVVVTSAELKRGDCLILCSDGLWGKVEPDEIRELSERFSPSTACESLVHLARDRGGDDNITVIVAKFDGEGLAEPSAQDVPIVKLKKSRWRSWFSYRFKS
jgi:protein phosphatase